MTQPTIISISLRLPSKACHPNAGSPGRWRAKVNATKKDRKLACYCALEAMGGQTFGWRTATERVLFMVKGRNDPANLSGWLKAYRDGFVDAGILVNDDRITHLPIEQIVDRKAPTGVIITLTKGDA